MLGKSFKPNKRSFKKQDSAISLHEELLEKRTNSSFSQKFIQQNTILFQSHLERIQTSWCVDKMFGGRDLKIEPVSRKSRWSWGERSKASTAPFWILRPSKRETMGKPNLKTCFQDYKTDVQYSASQRVCSVMFCDVDFVSNTVRLLYSAFTVIQCISVNAFLGMSVVFKTNCTTFIPSCFRNVDSLPVQYHSKNVWVT